jgi:hypothetical protein
MIPEWLVHDRMNQIREYSRRSICLSCLHEGCRRILPDRRNEKICDIQARLALFFNSRPNKSFGRNRTWNDIETCSWNECEEGSNIVEMKNPTTNLYPFVIWDCRRGKFEWIGHDGVFIIFYAVIESWFFPKWAIFMILLLLFYLATIAPNQGPLPNLRRQIKLRCGTFQLVSRKKSCCLPPSLKQHYRTRTHVPQIKSNQISNILKHKNWNENAAFFIYKSV